MNIGYVPAPSIDTVSKFQIHEVIFTTLTILTNYTFEFPLFSICNLTNMCFSIFGTYIESPCPSSVKITKNLHKLSR